VECEDLRSFIWWSQVKQRYEGIKLSTMQDPEVAAQLSHQLLASVAGSNTMAGGAAVSGPRMAAARGPTQGFHHNQRLTIHRPGGPACTRASSRVDALQALGIPVKLAIRKPGIKQSRAPAGPVGGNNITSGEPLSLSSIRQTLVLSAFLVPSITAT
jgi:hypothetical protein